uniref:DNA-directed DNA polymerase n=1 Tax=viral metagenome TaxID=1070528 RepID=A0A6M3J2K5_9ZZZZ
MTGEEILQQFESAITITEWDKEAERLLKKPRGIICCDTETTGLLFHTPSYFKDEERWCQNPFPFGLSLCFEHEDRLVLVWGRYGSKLYDECKRILSLPNIKIWHNMKYDLRVCKTNGIEVRGPQHDTLTMSRIVWDRRKDHRLQALSEFICPEISAWEEELNEIKKREKSKWTRTVKKENIWLPEGMEAKDFWNYSFLPHEVIGTYSMCDVFVDFIIYQKIAHEISSEFRDLYVRERKIVEVVTKIEETGLRWDIERAKEEIAVLEPKMDKALETFTKLGKESQEDFTTHPPKVIKALKYLGVKENQLKDGGRITTEEDILHRCLKEGVPKKAEQFIKALMDYRAYAKILNTYMKPLTLQAERNDGIVYTTINPTDTRTGRPASRDPNLLNIPKPTVKKKEESNPVRACFIPREGCAIYYFDVSQQEMAVFALMADDYSILDAYKEGKDIHQYMADQIGWGDKRDIVKNINFGVLYGTGIKHMAKTWRMTLTEAKETMRIYMQTFGSVKTFQEKCKWELQRNGYVEDFFGRRYHVPVNQAYKAVNSLVQGGCAQAFKMGLLQVDKYVEKHNVGKLLLPIYDECQLETPKLSKADESQLCRNVIKCMSDIPQLVNRGLKLRIDVEKTETSWACKEKIEI